MAARVVKVASDLNEHFYANDLRLNMALRVICSDNLGKEAVRDGLRLIKLQNVKDQSAMKMTFENGVLEMHCAYALKTDGMYSDNEIRELLVNKL